MHGSWGVLPDIFLFRIIGDNDAYFVQTYEGCNYGSDIIGLNQKEPNSKGDAEFSPVLILS